MRVTKLQEAGVEAALKGLSLSWHTPRATLLPWDRAKAVADRLAFRDGGHNKFLESIVTWWDITAPIFWWAQADTYRLSTKQSESTMHTLLKRELIPEDFEYPIPEEHLTALNELLEAADGVEHIKNWLPAGYLQRRVWVLNYKNLQNIVQQRHNHRLPQWDTFCSAIKDQINHPEWIFKVGHP
jgi:hypothetical protein